MSSMSSARELAQRHLIPHFTPSAAWRSNDMVVIERGEGCYVDDSNGVRYLDALSGLFCTNLGHGRSDLTAAAAKQMDTLAYYSNWGYATPPTIAAAARIAEVAPADLNRVFFVNSGSEAVESALKFARSYHLARGAESRYRVIARNWSYHGTTLGALAVTGIEAFRDPFRPMLADTVSHVPTTLGWEAEADRPVAERSCVSAVEEAILAAGPETVAMVIAEPVQNGRGGLVPPSGYWQELRRICDRYGVLLCADEVINAFGRLGHWFGSDRFEVVPDMITFAKGVTSGYQPLGGLIVRDPLIEEIWDSPSGEYFHGSTYGGHPVATAVASAALTALAEENICAHVLAHEDHLGSGLRGLFDAHNCVKDVRGAGYFYFIELMHDRAAGRDLSPEDSAWLLAGGELARLTTRARVLVRPDGRGATMLAIAPPLVADKAVLDDLLTRLDSVLGRLDQTLATVRCSRQDPRSPSPNP